MKIVTLKDIDLTSSTIPENQYGGFATANGEWSAGTYANGDVVYYTGSTPHKVYQSIADSNTATPGTDITKWTDLGATDRWLMFDEYMNTQTTNTTSFTVEVDANESDYVGVFNCDATEITFSFIEDGITQATETIDMDSSAPTDYDEWFFSQAVYKKRAVWEFAYLVSATARLSITLVNSLTDTACGVLAIGHAYEIGGTTYDPEIGFNDYSYKYENETTGAVKMIPGNYSDVGSLKVWIGNAILDEAKRTLIENRGKVAIYDFNNDGLNYESFIFYGFPSKVRISIPSIKYSRISFTMRGMI